MQSAETEDAQSEEDKDFGPDTRLVCVGTDAEGLECGKNDEDGGPSVVKGEG